MKTKQSREGFSRIDLIAVIATISLLALTFGADGRSNAEGALCQNNKRALVRAQFLYAADHEFFPPNHYSGIGGFTNTWVGGGAEQARDDFGHFASEYIANSLLAEYFDRKYEVLKCPSDTARTFRGNGFTERVRSVSMNNAVGTDPTDTNGPCKRPVPGLYLGHTGNQTYRCYARPSDIVSPTPANLFIFLDEHYNSINDAFFGSQGPTSPANLRWIDVPAAYHNGAGSFAFADGRALLQRWNAPFGVTANAFEPPVTQANRPDLQWLTEHTSALRTSQP